MGLQGTQGTQAAQGTQGFGYQGVQGLIGFQGTTGSQGTQGATGTQGFYGFQGYTGAQGYGAQGYTGPQGTAGNNGTQGYYGTQGVSGTALSFGSGYVVYGSGSGVTASSNLSFDGTNLTCAGNVTAYSDESLKTNIQPITDALAKVNQMRGVMFDRIEDGVTSTGVIAQEIQQILPEVVVKHDVNGLLSVAYGNIVGILIEAIKELTNEVNELKKMIKQ